MAVRLEGREADTVDDEVGEEGASDDVVGHDVKMKNSAERAAENRIFSLQTLRHQKRDVRVSRV